ncbi:MAG: DUF1232 domain-containing protein [Verrucomicrobiota bacterium]|nr:DUF1232 domain-containing protein [Verrucomicrobiota bacterium]
MDIEKEKYGKYYSKNKLWDKIISIPKSVGKGLIHKAVVLYVILTNEDTPTWLKISIVVALGYFICPLDAVPDFIPFAGYADDLAVLTLLMAEASIYDTEDVSKRVRKIEEEWEK